VVVGTAVPTPPVTATVVARPALSYVVLVVRVTPLAVSLIEVVLPQESYSQVLVASRPGLPPPVMAPPGPLEHSRSAHSGRPSQAPVPVADQCFVTRVAASVPVAPGHSSLVTRPLASYS